MALNGGQHATNTGERTGAPEVHWRISRANVQTRAHAVLSVRSAGLFGLFCRGAAALPDRQAGRLRFNSGSAVAPVIQRKKPRTASHAQGASACLAAFGRTPPPA